MSVKPSKYLPFLLTLLVIFTASGQDRNCSVNLREAQNQYNLGQIESVPGLLLDCIESGFTRDERIQAFKLLINSYIFDDNQEQAEKYAYEFMKKYPEYEVVATDLSEFVNLLGEFNNDPRSSIGIGGGLNFSRPRIIEPFGPDAYTGLGKDDLTRGVYSSSGSGFQAGIVYTYNIGKGFELGVEPMIIQNTYHYEYYPFNFSFVEYSEDQFRVDLPVSLLKTFTTRLKIVPYIRTGLKTSYLLSASSEAKRSYLNTGSYAFEEVTGPRENINEKRNINNYWVVLGGGFRYKIPRAYIFVDLRYNLGIQNQVNTISRNNGQDENFWLYYYLQDDFYLDDFAVNVGISKTIYRPKRNQPGSKK